MNGVKNPILFDKPNHRKKNILYNEAGKFCPKIHQSLPLLWRKPVKRLKDLVNKIQ